MLRCCMRHTFNENHIQSLIINRFPLLLAILLQPFRKAGSKHASRSSGTDMNHAEGGILSNRKHGSILLAPPIVLI